MTKAEGNAVRVTELTINLTTLLPSMVVEHVVPTVVVNPLSDSATGVHEEAQLPFMA